jgi:hypothetical protein
MVGGIVDGIVGGINILGCPGASACYGTARYVFLTRSLVFS